MRASPKFVVVLAFAGCCVFVEACNDRARDEEIGRLKAEKDQLQKQLSACTQRTSPVKASAFATAEGSSSQSLIDAIKAADADKLKNLLAPGVDPNSIENEYGAPPVELAAAKGQTDMVKLLLARGADANKRSKTGAAALNMAVESVNLDIVRMLVENGADVNSQSPAGVTAIEQLSARATDGPTQGKKALDLMKYLVDKGADISHDHYKAYFLAAMGGNRGAVEYLVHNGVSVNTKSPYGVSGLMAAASRGRAGVVTFLLKNGADPSSLDNDHKTALDYALESHDQETIDILRHGRSRGRRH